MTRHSRWRSALRRFIHARSSRILLVVLVVLLVAGFVVDRGLDKPLRRIVERNMNEKLQGYTAQVGALDFHLLGFSLDLDDVKVYQNAHPDPAVLVIPRLTTSVHWRALLAARLVADSVFESPTVYLNLVQLREENDDELAVEERGWQDAFQSIYPLRLNELRVRNGSLVYQDDSEFRPLEASRIELLARNIRNIQSSDHEYPSPIHAEGVVFDVGKFVIDGNADFLAEPHPGVQATLALDQVELSYFEPVARRFSLSLREGLLTAQGSLEYAPAIQIVDLDSVVFSNASIDYLFGGEPTENAKWAAQEISTAAKDAMNNPQVLFRIRRLVMENGTVGFVNNTSKPEYRVYVSNANFYMENLSSRAEDGTAQASLTGNFMGTGEVKGSASFFPEGDNANFEANLAIAETQLKAMNEMLLAHGNFDVVGGVFSLYTEVKVKDGYIDGYVKPLFRDLNVYDAQQDKKKNVFRKIYEGLVGGVANLLENKRDEVATVARISGPVEDPNSNALQIIGNLIQNGFFKAILPGFQEEIARAGHRRQRPDDKDAKRRRA